jgi:hypothetical protein
MPQYKLKLRREDGTEKEVNWDKERDPTDEEMEALLNTPDSKPGVLSRAISGAGNFIGDIYTGVKDTGKRASDDIRKGNYAEAFHDIAAPITRPFEGITGTLTGNKPSNPGTEIAETAGIPLSSIKKDISEGNYAGATGRGVAAALLLGIGAKYGGKSKASPTISEPIPTSLEHGPYPLRDYSRPIGPEINTTFEGLTKPKESPQIHMDVPQPELPLEFIDTSTQGNLKYQPKSAGIKGSSPQIDAFEGLVPDRYKITEPEYTPTTGPAQPELFTPNELHQSEVRPPSIMEYNENGLGRPTWSRFAEQKELPFDYDGIQAAETSGVPEVAKAAKQLVESELKKPVTFSRKSGYTDTRDKQGTIGRTADDFIKSNYAALVQDSPAGKSIAGMIDKYRAETGRISGEISAAIKDVVSPLSPSQYAEFQRRLDKGDAPIYESRTIDNPTIGNRNPNAEMFNTSKKEFKAPTIDNSLPPEFAHMAQPSEMDIAQSHISKDPMVQLAVDTVRNIDSQFTSRVQASGMHLRLPNGEVVPFVGKENYWPRIYDASLFKDKPALIERLIKQGLSPEAASKAVGNMRRFGERLIDPQNARVLDLPEHRKDIGALLKHYDDMAHRVAASEIFGVKDIADPNTPISQLVAQTKDPSRVTKILTQYLDRETGVSPHEADFVKSVSKFTTLFYLSRFALSNTNQLAFVPVLTDLKSTGKALSQFISNPKKTWREAEATGALQTVMQEGMREVGGESLISKAFGIKVSEGSNRTISAIAGKHYAMDLFAKAKKGNVRAQKSISDLTLEPWETLSNQDRLTDKNIAYAATRVVEKTQGRAQSIDLPYNWSRSPYVGLLLLYKKYAFVQGKLLKAALKNDPSKPFVSNEGVNINPRNAALLLALFNTMGEATGDAKAAISGAITGDPMQAIQDRGKGIDRVLRNYIDSMFLGLIGDLIQAGKSGKSALYQTAVGPVVSLPIETAGNISSDMKNPPKSLKRSQTVRGIASKIPYIGPAVNRSFRDTSIH